MGPDFSNSVLDELDGLTPPAKNALILAHTRVAGTAPPSLLAASGGGATGRAPAPTLAGPAPALPALQPAPAALPASDLPAAPAPVGTAQPRAIAAPGANKIAPLAPPSSGAPSNLANDKAELTRLTSTGSGTDQIHNPWLRVPLKILGAVGGGLFPGIAMNIPGTDFHHQLLVNERAADVARDEALESERSKNALEGAQTAEATARGNEADARAEAVRNPQDEFSTVSTTGGYDVFSKKHGTAQPLVVNGEQAQPVEKFTAPHYETLSDGSVLSLTTDPKTGVATPHIVFKGDPKVETELAKLEIGGKQHSVIVDKKTGNTIKDLGETGEKPPTVNVNASTAALDRESTRFAKSWEKSSESAGAQLEKIADARAMLNGSAESQALGVPKVLTALVGGQGTGVRITTPELNAIAKARGISGDFEGFLNKISGKGALTSTQQQQLTQILDDVKTRILQKQQIANDALDGINSGASREEIIRIDKEARKKLSDFESGGGQQGGSKKNSSTDPMGVR